MAFQWLLGIVVRAVGVAADLGGRREQHAPARLGRGRPRRRHQPLPRPARLVPPGPAVDALHHRRRADADGRAADSPDRRPHRNALPRLRLAGVPRVLSRLARPDSGHHRRRARSHAARHVLAAVGLRRARRQPVALARTRGLGRLRRHLPRRRVPAQHRGNAADRRTHRRARARSAHPPGSGDTTRATRARATTRILDVALDCVVV